MSPSMSHRVSRSCASCVSAAAAEKVTTKCRLYSGPLRRFHTTKYADTAGLRRERRRARAGVDFTPPTGAGAAKVTPTSSRKATKLHDIARYGRRTRRRTATILRSPRSGSAIPAAHSQTNSRWLRAVSIIFTIAVFREAAERRMIIEIVDTRPSPARPSRYRLARSRAASAASPPDVGDMPVAIETLLDESAY